jgi:hypothetical protein
MLCLLKTNCWSFLNKIYFEYYQKYIRQDNYPAGYPALTRYPAFGLVGYPAKTVACAVCIPSIYKIKVSWEIILRKTYFYAAKLIPVFWKIKGLLLNKKANIGWQH